MGAARKHPNTQLRPFWGHAPLAFRFVGSAAKANNRMEKQQNTRASAPRKPTQANNPERFAIYTITATKCPLLLHGHEIASGILWRKFYESSHFDEESRTGRSHRL